MILEIFCSGPLNTNGYLVACPVTKKAALFDAPLDCFDKVNLYINHHHLDLQTLFLTHSHFDHIADVSVFKKNFPQLNIAIHPLDQKNLIQPGFDRIEHFPIQGVHPTQLIHDHEVLSIGEMLVKVIHTPGHSPGGVCYLFEKEKILISGDTLFKGTYGILSLPTAEPLKMKHSLHRLSLLDPDIKVFPGHGKSTTIHAEAWLKDF